MRAIWCCFQFFVDPRDHLLVRLCLPAAVAAHYNKIAVRSQVVGEHVRIRCDGVLLRSQALLLLKFQIAQRPRQIEMTIDAALRDDTPRRMNPVNLHLTLRLMIKAERDSIATPTHGTA